MAPLAGGFTKLHGTSGGGTVKTTTEVREVWAWNLDQEFGELVAAVADAGPGGASVALDLEFPGFICQEPRVFSPNAQVVRHQALCNNVDQLQPIQLGVAVAGSDGTVRGVWSFNFNFDLDVHRHTKKSVAFLRAAGIDFERLASEGIEATALGLRLAGSRLINNHNGRVALPRWVTFSGTYDLGYLVKLLTANRPLPNSAMGFDVVLSSYCPHRHELRDDLPHGSLDTVARRHGIKRRGKAHTAGSDALLTLELFLKVAGPSKIGSKIDARADAHNSAIGEQWANSSNIARSEARNNAVDEQWAMGNNDARSGARNNAIEQWAMSNSTAGADARSNAMEQWAFSNNKARAVAFNNAIEQWAISNNDARMDACNNVIGEQWVIGNNKAGADACNDAIGEQWAMNSNNNACFSSWNSVVQSMAGWGNAPTTWENQWCFTFPSPSPVMLAERRAMSP